MANEELLQLLLPVQSTVHPRPSIMGWQAGEGLHDRSCRQLLSSLAAYTKQADMRAVPTGCSWSMGGSAGSGLTADTAHP